MPHHARLLGILAVLSLTASACSSGGDDDGATTTTPDANATTTTAPDAEQTIVFNGQGNDLAAYTGAPPFEKQIVIHHRDEEHPDGLDINAQICFDPENPRRFVAGEDTLQTTTGEPGWGIFELEGSAVGELSARQIGKLVPTYQPANDNPENYGCEFLADGRIITTDIGNQATGPGDGQLIVWFGPFDSFDVPYCKIDIGLTTGQGAYVDREEGTLLIAQARAAGVYRYDVADFPTSDTPEGGCGGTDATGAPLTTGIAGERVITPGEGNTLATPNGIARAANGNLYVSSVFNGVISEFEPNGSFVQTVLAPPEGEALGAEPYSTGTPLGIGVAPDGSVYYADIGIVFSDTGIGPGRATGKVRRITFNSDHGPEPPVEMDSGLAFPDGIGVWVVPSS